MKILINRNVIPNFALNNFSNAMFYIISMTDRTNYLYYDLNITIKKVVNACVKFDGFAVFCHIK